MTLIDKRTETLEAFEAQALPHANELFRTAVSLLGTYAEAEAAVQKSLLHAWKSFSGFQPGSNCRAWLYKILFQVVAQRRRRWLRLWGEDPQIFKQALFAKAEVAQRLTDEDILSALREMPQQYAEVVILSDVQEFTYQEIQETLDIPIGTVMSRLSRGRAHLRSELSPMARAVGAA